MIHNFIRINNLYEDDFYKAYDAETGEAKHRKFYDATGNDIYAPNEQEEDVDVNIEEDEVEASIWRDNMAEAMWISYQAELVRRGLI